MTYQEPIDRRTFRRWRKIDAQGHEVAIVEFEARTLPPSGDGFTYVEIVG